MTRAVDPLNILEVHDDNWGRATKLKNDIDPKSTRQNGQADDAGDPLLCTDANDVWEDDDELIPPRGWLLGNTFCRQFLSALFADGGVGKTALRIAQYLSCATGRNLTNEHVFVRCRVLIICLEDGRDELRRRLRAARLHYGITAADVKDWLFLWTPKGIRLMETDNHGKLVIGKLEPQLRHQIKLHKIDLVGVDPFIKSHNAPENDNNAIDAIASVLVTIGQEYDCATDTSHHTRKGPSDPGNADTGRGAGSLKDAGRIVDTLTQMTREEAELFNLSEQERKHLIRLDNGKANLVPRAADARWFKLIGVGLGNGTDLYPHGDEVQTVECWTPPDDFAGVTTDTWNAIIDEIDAGLSNRQRYTNANKATDRAAWKIVIKHIDRTEKQARAIINAWVKNQVFLLKPYDDPVERKMLNGLVANHAKRPG
jgi:hypothetical protein